MWPDEEKNAKVSDIEIEWRNYEGTENPENSESIVNAENPESTKN